MKRIIYGIVLYSWLLSCFAWNAVGHRVVAQIAYDNLSTSAKLMCSKYLHPRRHNLNSSFVSASTWLDEIRFRDINWYTVMHYIDIPFSADGTKLPPIESTNAVWAMKQARTVFLSKKTNVADKQLALRMLLHIVGDIHQPLHAITQISTEHPEGDLGGNLFALGPNPVGNNLHKYWDNGAGVFMGHYTAKQVKAMARKLEKSYPCPQDSSPIDPSEWAQMSYNLGINNVYQLNPKDSPSDKYQKNAQILVQKQAVFAGCRLATLLNEMAQVG